MMILFFFILFLFLFFYYYFIIFFFYLPLRTFNSSFFNNQSIDVIHQAGGRGDRGWPNQGLILFLFHLVLRQGGKKNMTRRRPTAVSKVEFNCEKIVDSLQQRICGEPVLQFETNKTLAVE